MALKLTQQMVGVLRRNLEQIESNAQLITPYDRKHFWSNELFEFGIAQAVLDIAATYRFEWSRLLPDLFLARFTNQDDVFLLPLPEMICEQFLRQLMAYALLKNKSSPFDSDLRRLVKEAETDQPDGVDTGAPAALSKLPTKDQLIADLQRRLGTRDLIAVVFIDLDGFKPVNDTLGHDEGDKCLVRILEIIGVAISGKGRLYRPGGDEFVVTLPNFSRHEAAATAERIRAAIETGNPAGSLSVTASIGVTDSEQTVTTDALGLFQRADATMYRGKHGTKNCVVIDDGTEMLIKVQTATK